MKYFIILFFCITLHAQTQSTKPPNVQKCTVPNATWNYNQPSGISVVYICVNGSWNFAGALAPAVPVGSSIIIDSGACPSGYTENTALDGYTVIATLGSHGDVGTTGGSNTATPTISGSPSYTPNNGTLAVGLSGTPGGTVGTPIFTGGVGTQPSGYIAVGQSGNLTFTGSFHAGLSVTIPIESVGEFFGSIPDGDGTNGYSSVVTGVGNTSGGSTTTTGFTPAGTLSVSAPIDVTMDSYTPSGTVSAPSFTGGIGSLAGSMTGTVGGSVGAGTLATSPIDNRSAFKKVIFCKKS